MNSYDTKELLLDVLNKVYPDSETLSTLGNLISVDQTALLKLIRELIKRGMPLVYSEQEVRLLVPVMSKTAIQQNLAAKSIGENILLFQSVPSTNDYLKKHLLQFTNGTLILAHTQSLGKGRLGREWSSPAGKTISMSLLLKPNQSDLNYSILTQLAAAALVKALDIYTYAEIKWPNDVLIDKKKVAGILTEAEFSGNRLEGIIIGVGINTNIDPSDIAPELKEKATSLKTVTGPVDPNLIISRFLNYFEDFYEEWLMNHKNHHFLDICRSQSALIGENYWIEENKGSAQTRRKAKIETINDSGSLVVTYLDTLETTTLISTHYSIRSDTGYI